MKPSGFIFSIAHFARSAAVRQGAVGKRWIHVRLKGVMKERGNPVQEVHADVRQYTDEPLKNQGIAQRNKRLTIHTAASIPAASAIKPTGTA